MDADELIRREIIAFLTGNNAYEGWRIKIGNWPADRIGLELPGGSTPNGGPINAWTILEHMRICQHDIVEFIRDPAYTSPDYPEGYWPSVESSGDETVWRESYRLFTADMKDLVAMAQDPRVDLYAPLKHAPDYTILRELILVGNHNAYHIGQFGLLEELV